MSAQKDYQRLLELLAEIDDLQRAASILNYEKQVSMPKLGDRWRNVQMTTLTTLAHERMTSAEMGRLLERLGPWAEGLDYHSDEASLIRLTRRLYDQKAKLGKELASNLASVRNNAYQSWLKAREENDFSIMVPDLKRLIDCHFEMAKRWGYTDHILDPLIDERDPGFTASSVEKMFDDIKPVLVGLVKRIRDCGKDIRTYFLAREFPASQQLAVSVEALKLMGLNMDRIGVAEVVHPFCAMFSPDDVRVTTRVKPDNPAGCLLSCMHEGGHALYSLGLPVKCFRTPLCDAPSAGMHESQSRMWENLVGRSRGFWELFYPTFKAAFPQQLADVSVEEWYMAINRVEPTPIRVEADEVTYNLHIMIRYELEKAVYDGKVKVEELEDAYNDKFREYMGIVPPNVRSGVGQDIHWTLYFGTSYQGYTMGNIAAVQFYTACLDANPELQDSFDRGDYSGLLRWTSENVHVHGAKFPPNELITIATGRPLDPKPYIDYIKAKYSELYGFRE